MGKYLCMSATVALALSLLIGERPVPAAQAGRIDSIDPSCASVGDGVTITGIGFGSKNVKIAVGAVPAQVLSATGNRATFLVPVGVPLGPTTVTATNPGGHIGSMAYQVCDLRLPASWAGQWEITVTYQNPETNNINAVDELTDVICANEHAGLALFEDLASCTGTSSDTHLEVRCSGEIGNGTCNASATVVVVGERTGDTFMGSGEWNATFSSGCGSLPVPVGEGVAADVSGVRLSTAQNGCGSPSSNLVRKFVRHPLLVVLGIGGE